MAKLKIGVVVGTRPEVIKMFPVYKALKGSVEFDVTVINTGQHRDMIGKLLDVLGIAVDFDLAVMRAGQSLSALTSEILRLLDVLLATHDFDWILVQGDTSSAMAVALGAFYTKIRVGHVEAGLRTYEKYEPFPEEVNRQIITRIADAHFAPTDRARDNLIGEGVDPKAVFVTGNTVVDAVHWILSNTTPDSRILPLIQKDYVLATAHRRENWDGGIEAISEALINFIRKNAGIEVVFAAHKNPVIRGAIMKKLAVVENGTRARFHVIDPVDYPMFVHLMKNAMLIVSDSGGIQEEAPSLGVKVICARRVTERPEAVKAGFVQLMGTNPVELEKAINDSLRSADPGELSSGRSGEVVNPFGDGKAAYRIRDILARWGEIESQ